MVKNLYVINTTNHRIDKVKIHKLVREIRSLLEFEISSLQVNFIQETEIRVINSKYLKHNYATDIITFNYSRKRNVIDAELFICPAIAYENAKAFKVTNMEEISRLVIHGLLHNLGFDDKVKSDKVVMKKEEDRLVVKTKNLFKR